MAATRGSNISCGALTLRTDSEEIRDLMSKNLQCVGLFLTPVETPGQRLLSASSIVQAEREAVLV